MKQRFLSMLILFGYLLGIQDGFVALWKDGQQNPAEVFPCPVAVLPPQDQEKLRRGIPVESQEDLYRLLEDYLS